MKEIQKFILISLLILAVSCSADEVGNIENNEEPETGEILMNFKNVVGNQDLRIGQNTYSKNGGESFSVDELKYIISNIVLIDTNGNEFVYPQEDSYFLINQEVAQSQTIRLQNINANDYSGIRFGLGVDQSNYPLNGVDNFVPTAEENGMLWSWSAGYIFMKIEGLYSSSQITDAPYRYHIGSHGSNLDNYKEVSLDFLQPIAAAETQTPEVNINFDVLKLFSGPFDMRLQDKDDIQIDPENAPKIRDNYSKAFEIGLN